ncbi:unnamed protein product, partial [Mesorhabditis belari]|uniref:Aspartate aminotransferase n=1 Tax=Mesorhabditis belari TaxID=2138241 RepID=A0AAF3EP98_9BILA
MGAEFLARILKLKTAYYSDPTWGNHDMVFTNAGFTSCHSYRFWDSVNKRVDIEGFLEDLESAPSKSVIILHGCAHNPTGMDPTKEQWKQICEVVKRKNLFPFFDMAYQGFASGDPAADGWAVRYFIEQGLEMFIAQSFAKNFGLYNERVGHLTIVLNDPSAIPSFKSQMQLIIRANWSNPPAHGARIVAKVLGDRELYQQWLQAIQTMSSRIREMRAALKANLEKLGTPGTWDHITQQIGMFSYTGLTRDQVMYLVDKYHIFMLTDGRANICGLNTKNVEYVSKAIDDAIRNVKS